ncbi:unnamed protein product, partial [Effrenium voratum]
RFRGPRRRPATLPSSLQRRRSRRGKCAGRHSAVAPEGAPGEGEVPGLQRRPAEPQPAHRGRRQEGPACDLHVLQPGHQSFQSRPRHAAPY